MPLDNLSRDPEQEHFADGITDALITDLAQISSLRVISRTSVMPYKGVKKPLPDIARELDVDAVVEGAVQRVGNRVRITAQLIHAPTDRHLWANSYERDLRDLLALQSEVTRAIAGEIQVRVTPAEKARLTERRRVDPDAYEAYLRGKFAFRLHDRTGDRTEPAIQWFERAVSLDPGFALAHAALARAYVFKFFSYDPHPQWEQRAFIRRQASSAGTMRT